MKRLILILLFLSATVYAVAWNDDPHLKRLIECINDSDFVCAAEELPLVENWELDEYPDSMQIVFARKIQPMAALYEKKGNINQAIAIHEIVRNIYKKIFGELTPDYADELMALGRLYKKKGRYKEAESCYLRYRDIIAEVLGENDDAYAAVLNDMGGLYLSTGDYQSAEKCYLEAIRISIENGNENTANHAHLLSNIGLLYGKKGDNAKAEMYFLRALELVKVLRGDKHPSYANVLNSLGGLCSEKGDYVTAKEYYLQALHIFQGFYGEAHPNCVTMMNNLGRIYEKTGEYDLAEKYYSVAVHYVEKTLGTKNKEYLTLRTNLGSLYISTGDYSKAESILLQTLDDIRNLYGERHPMYMVELNNLGFLYDMMDDNEQAEKYYLEAVKIQKEVLGENHPKYANTLNNLGHIYTKKGEFDKAEECVLNSLQIRKNIYGEKSIPYANVLNSLGYIYDNMEKYVLSEQYYLQAIQIKIELLGERHQDYALSLKQLGLLYVKMKKYEKSALLLKKSTDIDITYFARSVEYMSENQRQSYWNTFSSKFERIFPDIIFHCYEEYIPFSSFAYDNELFRKGILLQSSNIISNSILESGDSVLISRWNELTTKKQQIIVLEEKSSQSEYVAQLREEAEQLEKEITRTSVAYRENIRQWNLTWDSVRTHLSKKQVAIEYMVAPLNADSTMYCALLLRKNSKYPKLIPLFEEKELLSLVNTSTESRTNGTYSVDGNGEALQQLVWSKILPYIKPCETIYFAPSGVLHQVAIEALPYDETHTMGDKFNLVRLSSTREIVLNKTNDTHTTATLYGGIQYDMTTDELLTESEQYSATTLLASRGIENDTLDRGSVNYLPGTKKEVESIDKMLKDNKLSVQLFTMTSANEESFKAISGKHQNILHIATHGFYWSDTTARKKDYFVQQTAVDDSRNTHPSIDPLNRCGLLFAGANTALSGHSADLPEGVQDGILTAKEISLLDLRDADLVVLSACETGKGEITGEGVFGLQRAFKQAGAQTIIMSLWPVNDAATQLLMTEFYRNWITNRQPKREAFRNAQNTVRAQFEEPAYWAGFIMLD